MAKENALSSGSLIQELFQTTVYKRNQGKLTRRVTFIALVIVFALAAWRLKATLVGVRTPGFAFLGPLGGFEFTNGVRMAVSGALLGFGAWFSFRLVCYPKFADFLIAVEAEMNKVSWPTWGEMRRASFVVIALIFFMAAILALFDLIWRALFVWLGVVQ